MNLSLEDQIRIKKDRINPILSIICTFLSSITLLLMVLITLEFFQNLVKFYLNVSLPLKTYSDTILFSNIASIFLLISVFFFIWFGLGTQKCNINAFGFWFGVPGASVLFICFTINYIYLLSPLSLVAALLSFSCIIIGSLLFIFRHKVDRNVIFQLIPLNDKITELNLQKLNCPYGLLRLQRALERGIRAKYLNSYYYLDKGKLMRGEVEILDKMYIYRHVHPPHILAITGYTTIVISIFFLLSYFKDGIFPLIISFILFGLGNLLANYHFVRWMNLGKTILILDQWLRMRGEIDLAKLDKEYGFLPIKYSLSTLKHISKKFESFLNAKLTGEKIIKK